MRVVVAPDKFKGTLDAGAVAAAMMAGVRRAAPRAEIVASPLADGGEGTLHALRSALGGEVETITVAGPHGEPVEAPIALLRDGRVAIESAAAAGLSLLSGRALDALTASSRGVGELVVAAAARGRPVIAALGGVASTDGGTGAARATGWRFLDRRGRELPHGGGALTRLERIDGGAVAPLQVEIIGAFDVTNPLVGPDGTARVFAPQKGASDRDVEVLEAGMERLAARIEEQLGVDVRDLHGGGAAGGLGAGLVAFLGARLVPGAELVIDATGLAGHLVDADVVITGEGRLDEQSLSGKTPIAVAAEARAAGVTCLAVAGEVLLDEDRLRGAGIDHAISLVEIAGRERAIAETAPLVSDATARLIRSL